MCIEKKVQMETVVDCQPPEYVLPGNKERPLVPLHPLFKEPSVYLSQLLCLIIAHNFVFDN